MYLEVVVAKNVIEVTGQRWPESGTEFRGVDGALHHVLEKGDRYHISAITVCLFEALVQRQQYFRQQSVRAGAEEMSSFCTEPTSYFAFTSAGRPSIMM